MTLQELLTATRSLSRRDKARLIQEVAKDLELDTPALAPEGEYPIWSPLDSEDAAARLLNELQSTRSEA